MYTKLEKIQEIHRLYKKYQKEIKLKSPKDMPDDDEDQPQTDEDNQEGNDQSESKKPSKTTPRDDGNQEKNKPKKPKRDRGEGDEDELGEQGESNDDSNQPDDDDYSPNKKDRTKGEEGNDESDNEETDSGKPEKSNTKDSNKKFRKEKNELKGKRIIDDKDSYIEKRKLLREIINFKRYQSRSYLKRFRKLFNFEVKTERFFKFIKHCYRHKRIPKNFNQVMNKVIRMYTKLEKIQEIHRLYKKYQKEIKLKSPKVIPDDDEDQPQTDEDNQEGNDQSDNKRPSKNTPRDNRNEEENKAGKPKTNNGSPKSSNKESEVVDLDNNSGKGRNTPVNTSQRKGTQITNIQDSEKTYLEKHLFLRYLTFEQYNNPRNMDQFYNLFGFRIRTKIVFKFLKYCYRFRRMPPNHNRVLNKLLTVLKILRPNSLHKYFDFFLKKYDKGVAVYSNEDSNSPINGGNKNPNISNGRGNSNQNNNFSNRKDNKGPDGKTFFWNGKGNKVSPFLSPNVILKKGSDYNSKNVPKEDANQEKGSTKNQNNSDVDQFSENDEKSKSGNNTREKNKTNKPQTGFKPNNRNPPYYNGQLKPGYNAYENTDSIINNNNQQRRKPSKPLPNNIQNYNNNQNPKTDTGIFNFNEQYDENQSGSQNNMQYGNINPPVSSMSPSMNQQPNFNTYFNQQGSRENENTITSDTYESYNSQNQNTNNYEMTSMTYDYNQQYDNIQSESQYDMSYNNMSPLMDTMYRNEYRKPSLAQKASSYNSQNYYSNNFETSSMTSNMNQKQYINQYDNRNGLDSGFQDGSQNNMQGTSISSPQEDYTLYTTENQQSANSQSTSSYNTQSSNFEIDSSSYQQNLNDDVDQTENTNFLNGYQQHDYVYQPDIIQQNQPFFEDASD